MVSMEAVNKLRYCTKPYTNHGSTSVRLEGCGEAVEALKAQEYAQNI